MPLVVSLPPHFTCRETAPLAHAVLTVAEAPPACVKVRQLLAELRLEAVTQPVASVLVRLNQQLAVADSVLTVVFTPVMPPLETSVRLLAVNVPPPQVTLPPVMSVTVLPGRLTLPTAAPLPFVCKVRLMGVAELAVRLPPDVSCTVKPQAP